MNRDKIVLINALQEQIKIKEKDIKTLSEEIDRIIQRGDVAQDE